MDVAEGPLNLRHNEDVLAAGCWARPWLFLRSARDLPGAPLVGVGAVRTRERLDASRRGRHDSRSAVISPRLVVSACSCAVVLDEVRPQCTTGADRCKARNPRSDNLRLAPLAQSAERLHGKYPVRIAVLTCGIAGGSRPLCAQLDALLLHLVLYLGGRGSVMRVTFER